MNKPFVLADFRTDDPLSEYFSFKGTELDFLPEDVDAPLVDVIADRIKGKENVFLILDGRPWRDKHQLKRLYEQKSTYNEFAEVRKDLTLVIYSHQDGLLGLDELSESPGFRAWLNSLEPHVLSDGRAGDYFRKNFETCEFSELPSPWLSSQLVRPELSTLKTHDPKKDFLCLMTDKANRPHRKLLMDRIEQDNITENTISSFAPFHNNRPHDDLWQDYSQQIIESHTTHPFTLPPVNSYNQTNLEVVAEVGTRHNHDDTFVITEKTTKPIVMKHPFMILSNYGFLKNLRELGFQTFEDHIDESYDMEQDVEKRIAIIVENLTRIKGKTLKLYQDTKNIRDHNLMNLQQRIGMYKTGLWQRLDEFFNNI